MNITKHFPFFLLILLSFQSTRAQMRLPEPVSGWDSLGVRARPRELMKIIGLEGAFRSNVTIDSAGRITQLSTNVLNHNHAASRTDSMFVQLIENAIRVAKWIPGELDGTPTTMSISIPFFIYLNSKESTKAVIIKAERILREPVP